MKRLFVFFAVLVFLCPILASAGAEGKLRGLLDKGYIKGLLMDMRENQVVFTGRSARSSSFIDCFLSISL